MTNEEYKQLILLKKHFFEEKIELLSLIHI